MKAKMLLPTVAFILSVGVDWVHADVYIEGISDCGEWAVARKTNLAMALEHYVIGVLNGMSFATQKEFWQAKGVRISREAAYLWMDNYCQSHPFETILGATIALFRERTGLVFPQR